MNTRLLLIFVLGVSCCFGEGFVDPAYPAVLEELSPPAGAGAMGSSLVRAENGDIYLSWLEGGSNNRTNLLFAKFDPQQHRWSEARLIASGSNWFVNWADFPSLAAEADGRLTAVWYANNPVQPSHDDDPDLHHHQIDGYQAWISQSTDGGISWSEPKRLSHESDSVEFVSMQPLARGGLLAVWIDGRARASDGTQRLYGRLIDRDDPDYLIDDTVCDCCQTTLTAFPNGDALVAYRARREGETRDIYTALFQDGLWSEPNILSADAWRINGCPVNGPQLDSNGGNVTAVWFTGAANVSRIYASNSPDAGARFTMPQRIDLGNPLGRVDTLLLQDGSRLVTWLESSGEKAAGIYLRHILANDDLGPPVLLASSSQTRASGFPRIALVKDYDAKPAQLLLSYTRDQDPSAVATLLVTLPDLSTLAGREPCLPCDEQDASAAHGYPVKGRIVEVLADDRIKLSFDEIPGVMRTSTLSCKIDPELWLTLPENQELLGRIEQRDGDWWLFKVKLLGTHLRSHR